MAGWILLVLAVLLGVYIASGGEMGTLSELEWGQIAGILICLALAGIYALGLTVEYRGRSLKALSHAAIYTGLFLALMTGYAYRDELTSSAARVTGEFALPGTAIDSEGDRDGERSVRLRKRFGGQFSARSDVNGVTITMLVDTGASTVVLKPADAEKAGIELSSLSYTVPVDTANGSTFAAPVRIKSIAIGPIEIRDVEALVSKPGNLKESLLGMSFLKRLRSYEFSGDYLTLRG